MHFITPEGKEELLFSSEKGVHVVSLEDFSEGSRSFSLRITLLGKGEQICIIGRASSERHDQKEWKITVILAGEDQRATLSLHAIADGSSKIIFDGVGILEKNSQNGSLSIQEKVVLFSEFARAKAIPVLRVETDSVLQASHSASVAPFNEDLFFYCASRGLDQKETKDLLRKGFLGKPKEISYQRKDRKTNFNFL
jgi:Fe-S cluster assembly scaffold protein SufB